MSLSNREYKMSFKQSEPEPHPIPNMEQVKELAKSVPEMDRKFWQQQVLEYRWLIAHGFHRHAMVSNYVYTQARVSQILLILLDSCEPEYLFWIAELFNLIERPQSANKDQELPLRLAA